MTEKTPTYTSEQFFKDRSLARAVEAYVARVMFNNPQIYKDAATNILRELVGYTSLRNGDGENLPLNEIHARTIMRLLEEEYKQAKQRMDFFGTHLGEKPLIPKVR